MSFITKISLATRLSDWRFSFVPFILGCVYLWVWWFKIPFTGSGVLLLFLSLTTTAGFASLGYLINELFDIPSDLAAGKKNKLAGLPPAYIAAAFAGSVLVTFTPWLFLPTDKWSLLLIAAELLAFVLYSLPFPRLKAVPGVSNLLDAAYAYTIPLLLSFHTFSLAATAIPPAPKWLFFLFAAMVTVAGVRNIIIHQVDDIFSDKASGIKTLPMVMGVNAINVTLASCLALEISTHILWAATISFMQPVFAVWIVLYAVALVFTAFKCKEDFSFDFLSIHKIRHLPDNTNQIAFPAFALALLLATDCRWLIIIPFHALLLVPPLVAVPVKIAFRSAWGHTRNYVPHYFRQLVVYPCTLVVNYSIYFSFRAIGIDLKKRNESAVDVLKKIFYRN